MKLANIKTSASFGFTTHMGSAEVPAQTFEPITSAEKIYYSPMATYATKSILNLVFSINYYLEAIIMLRTKLGAAVLLSIISGGAYAAQCDIAIDATASMAFSLKEIAVNKSCKEVNLTFKNVGTMAKAMMGHNVVITKKSAMQAVLADGSTAGLAKNYVKDNDARVIAHTQVLGGGETTSIKFKVSELDPKEAYVFFCSFPGHAGIMNGVFKLL